MRIDQIVNVSDMQAQVGLWVRNGPEVAQLHYLYLTSFWAETGFDLDLLLLQLWLGQSQSYGVSRSGAVTAVANLDHKLIALHTHCYVMSSLSWLSSCYLQTL